MERFVGKGSSGTNTTNTVTNSAPPPEVMAQYQNVISQANQAASAPYTTGGFNASNMVAGFTPMQQQSYNTINNAQGMQQPYINQAQNYLSNSQAPIWNGVQQYGPNTMAQYANPYLQQAVGSTEAQMNNMDAQQQQQVMGNAISSGAWGGDRSAIAQAELANQQSLANNQTISNMENTGFNQQQGEFNSQQAAQIGANEANAWLGTQGSAIESNLGSTALNDTLQGASTQLQAGAQQQQLQQERLNVPYQQFQAQQAYPFQTGSWLSNISEGIGGSSGGIGSGSTTTPGPSTLGQLAGLCLGGYSLYQGLNAAQGGTGGLMGAVTGNKRGGAIKRAPGGFIPNFDNGGGLGGSTPGFMPSDAFMTGVPDASASSVGAPPAMGHGSMGPPKISAPSGSTGTATTTGGQQQGGLPPGTMAAMNLAGKAMSPGAAAPAATPPVSFTPAGPWSTPGAPTAPNLFINGPGDIAVGNTGAGAGAATGAGAAGDSAAAALPWQAGASAGAGAGAGAAAAGDAAATAGTAAATTAATDAAATAAGAAAADTAATAGADMAATLAANPELLLLAAKRGGAIPSRAHGGFIPKHYDDGGSIGGLTPAQMGSDPLQGNLYSQYANMSTEQLQQLNARSGGKNPTLMAALQKKQMSGGMAPTAQQAPMVQGVSPQPGTAPAQPQGILAQQGMARGGFAPQHFDDGGDVLDQQTPIPTSSAMPDTLPPLASATPSAAPMHPAGPPQGFAPAPAANDIPDHDAFMKKYSGEVANAAPYNAVNPWMALAQAGFGMAASRNPHILGAAGEGAMEGMQNLTAQQKEAAAESEKRGTLQEKGEGLYKDIMDHKDLMNQQRAELAERTTNDAAMRRIQQQVADQGKVIVDPFGQARYTSGPNAGQIIPDAPAAAGASLSPGDPVVSEANIWKQPVDKDGKPLTGDAALSSVPPKVGRVAQEIRDAIKPSPTSFGSRDPFLQGAESVAGFSDPTYTGNRFSTIHDFTSSSTPAGATVRSQNAIAEHLPLLQDAITALDNGNERPLNALANQIAKQNGEPAPTNSEMAMNIVSDEGVKAIIGSKAGVTDREEFSKNLSTSAGRKQLQGQLTTVERAVAGQMHAGEQAYNTGTGLDVNRTPADTYAKLNYRDKMMSESPNARRIFEKYYPTPLPPADKRVAGKTYWGPGGKQMTWTKEGDKYGWVAPQGAQ